MPKSKWSDEHYVTAYRLAAQGLGNEQIAKALGAEQRSTFKKWCTNHPALRTAIKQGRDRGQSMFHEFVYERLPENLKTLWQDLDDALVEGQSSVEALDRMFADHGQSVRQHMFLHAFVSCNFNPSKACKMVGITRATLNRWLETDPDFPQLFQELEWHKKNWLEDRLFALVASGDSPATIFANRAKNKDRGYDNKVTVEHQGTIEHRHSLVDLDTLELPHDVRVAILDAVRRQRAAALAALPAPDAVPDDTITVAGFETEAA